ncbi:hypothetical protein BV20DRAFT_983903 [Pilatotrama ljubarskyi]|nr:hypothetical protein BV20DRAFT_983903 [Pilatotrama ljubarskyi]
MASKEQDLCPYNLSEAFGRMQLSSHNPKDEASPPGKLPATVVPIDSLKKMKVITQIQDIEMPEKLKTIASSQLAASQTFARGVKAVPGMLEFYLDQGIATLPTAWAYSKSTFVQHEKIKEEVRQMFEYTEVPEELVRIIESGNIKSDQKLPNHIKLDPILAHIIDELGLSRLTTFVNHVCRQAEELQERSAFTASEYEWRSRTWDSLLQVIEELISRKQATALLQEHKANYAEFEEYTRLHNAHNQSSKDKNVKINLVEVTSHAPLSEKYKKHAAELGSLLHEFETSSDGTSGSCEFEEEIKECRNKAEAMAALIASFPSSKRDPGQYIARQQQLFAIFTARVQQYPSHGIFDSCLALVDTRLSTKIVEAFNHNLEEASQWQRTNGFVQTRSVEDNNKAALLSPQELASPFFFGEYKRLGDKKALQVAQNQNCLYSHSAVQYYRHIGITDYIIWSVSTSGHLGTLSATWYSSLDQQVYIIQNNFKRHTFNLSRIRSVLQYLGCGVKLLPIAQKLNQEMIQILPKIGTTINHQDYHPYWTKRGQLISTQLKTEEQINKTEEKEEDKEQYSMICETIDDDTQQESEDDS